MYSWLNQSRVLYILSNLIVLPATLIPFFDLLSNFSFCVAFILLIKKNLLLSLFLLALVILKNNSNYRFKLLLKLKGEEISKSDYECVYLFAWCTLLRYLLIGFAANQIVLFFK
tara:strand:- start:3102 stop:3443 length:342 start_codon:yes stop_codon:yes gene_type:complete